MTIFRNRSIFSLGFFLVSNCSTPHQSEESNTFYNLQQKVSFLKGYLMWDEIITYDKKPYDLELVIQGIRSAHLRKDCPFDEEDAFEMIQKYREEAQNYVAQQNLETSEQFIQSIKNLDGICEVIPDKLYYQTIVPGSNRQVTIEDSPLIEYSFELLNKQTYSPKAPLVVTLSETIVGFAEGVCGMREGEERTLYIHPDLAYGNFGGKLAPNSLLKFKVKLISVSPDTDSFD